MKNKLFGFITIALTALLISNTNVKADGFPEVYIPEKITSVKNQGNEGMCWAYSVAAVLEQSAINNLGYGEDIDINEHQLADVINNVREHPYGLTYGDYTTLNTVYEGGSEEEALRAIAGGVAPVFQGKSIDCGYGDIDLSIEKGYVIPSDDIEKIKKAVMEDGGVCIGVDGKEMDLAGNVFSYTTDKRYSTHSVAVIGWNDTIPAYEFTTRNGEIPSMDGGWLVKNSWGTQYGDNGFYWVSYDSAPLKGYNAVAFKVKNVDYDMVYQHDGCFYTTTQATHFVGTVYTAMEDLDIKEVGVFLNHMEDKDKMFYSGKVAREELVPSEDYIVSVHYIEDASKSPWENPCVAETNLYTDESGYFTVRFNDNYISFRKGDKFGICVRRADNGLVLIGVDSIMAGNHPDEANDNFYYAEEAETFGYKRRYTPRIKAFTVTDKETVTEPVQEEIIEQPVYEEPVIEVPSKQPVYEEPVQDEVLTPDPTQDYVIAGPQPIYEIPKPEPVQDVEDIRENTSTETGIPSEISVLVKQRIDLSGILNPYNEKVTYKVSKKAYGSVNSKGMFLAKKQGKITVTAVSKEDNYIIGKITVIIENASIKSAIKVSNGDYFNINDFITGTEKDAYWTSRNENIATVDENGNVTTLKKGKVTLVGYIDGVKILTKLNVR